MDIRLLEVSSLCKLDPMIRSGVKITLVKMKADLHSSDLIDVFDHAVTTNSEMYWPAQYTPHVEQVHRNSQVKQRN